MRVRTMLVTGLILVGVVFTPSDLTGCGPFFEEAVFTDIHHPYPVKDYLAGRLGVVQPTYSRKFLFVAYRYLSGKPLSPREQDSIFGQETGRPEERLVQQGSQWDPEVVNTWLDTRRKIPGVGEAPQIDVYRKLPGSQWESYLNCTSDAFQSALRTLDQRIRSFGLEHVGVRSWVQAQDTVFSNCSAGEQVPPEANEALPDLLKSDRKYQIAAAHFYAGKFDQAAQEFRQIGSDPSSPWREIAPYLAARALIRKATISASPSEVDKEVLARAEREVYEILQDTSRRGIHPAARRLLNFVSLRLHPLERLGEISRKLQNAASNEDFRQDLIDFRYLMDKTPRSSPINVEAARKTSDLTDWIMTFQEKSEPALAHALEKWKESGSAAWLVACAANIAAKHPESSNVFAAAAKVSKASPSYSTVSYHRVRALLEAADNDAARRLLDSLIPELRVSQPRSALNLFLAQRMKLAQTFEEFLRFAPRYLAGVAVDNESTAPPARGLKSTPPRDQLLFDADSVRIINQALPLSL